MYVCMCVVDESGCKEGKDKGRMKERDMQSTNWTRWSMLCGDRIILFFVGKERKGADVNLRMVPRTILDACLFDERRVD